MGVSSSETTVFELIIYRIRINIVFFNFSLIIFSLPKIFRIKSLLDYFFLKIILYPSIVLSGELSPPIASIAIEIFFDIINIKYLEFFFRYR